MSSPIKLSRQDDLQKYCSFFTDPTAYVVSRIDLQPQGESGASFRIWLNDDSQEALNLDTLSVGKENVLYCRVKEGAFPARLQRHAYYQLAEHVQEKNGKYLVSLNGRIHLIHQDV